MREDDENPKTPNENSESSGVSRRDFLKLTGLVATSAALASCNPTIFQRAAGSRKTAACCPLSFSLMTVF